MTLQAISIELGDANSKAFKSIDHVTWQDIPPFAVLTGLNGSGKTQLLQALAYKISGATHQQSPHLNAMPMRLVGDTIGRDEIAYLPSAENAFRIDVTNISALHQAKQQFLQRLSPQSVVHNIEAQILRERIQRKYGIQIQHNNPPELMAMLPDDFMFMLEYSEVSAGLSHVFVGYQLRVAEALLERTPEEQILRDLGRPPWEFVNEVLASAEFGYRVIPPPNKLMKDYQVKVAAAGSSTSLDLNDLSSGEKTILRTILWFYNTKHNNIFPKLFLLDEPDSHLHPSMTRQFIDVLKNVLVDQYNVRVILTTHSPSTVALAPEQSLFVMSRDQPRIRRPASKAEAIGLLTSGLVIVSPGSKFVLVESQDDAKYYDSVRDVLADQGPSKDPMALKSAPSLVFMPASSGKGRTKCAGGKTVVTQWVEKFDAAPLKEMFRGIIDLDEGNIGGPRVYVLRRYSIENYQLDPLVVFAILIEERKAPPLAGVGVSPGDEHLLRALPTFALQSIVDYVSKQIEPLLGALTCAEKASANVIFTNGINLVYPAWMLTKRGHDLLPIYQSVFGQMIITPPRLDKSFRRVRLVPMELAQIMTNLQDA
jgi:predicted ATPase